MDDIEHELEGMGMGQFFDLTQQALLRTEIEQIMLMGYDYLNADKLGDVQRRNRIFRILVGLSKKKKELTSLQECFAGKKIGHFRNTITDENARDWVFKQIEDAKKMNDWRIKPTPMSERISGASDEYDDGPELELDEVSPELYPNGTFELEEDD